MPACGVYGGQCLPSEEASESGGEGGKSAFWERRGRGVLGTMRGEAEEEDTESKSSASLVSGVKRTRFGVRVAIGDGEERMDLRGELEGDTAFICSLES